MVGEVIPSRNAFVSPMNGVLFSGKLTSFVEIQNDVKMPLIYVSPLFLLRRRKHMPRRFPAPTARAGRRQMKRHMTVYATTLFFHKMIQFFTHGGSGADYLI